MESYLLIIVSTIAGESVYLDGFNFLEMCIDISVGMIKSYGRINSREIPFQKNSFIEIQESPKTNSLMENFIFCAVHKIDICN